MKKAFITASTLAYLSCAAPPKIQVPIVEVQPCSGNIVDKGMKRVARSPKESPEKTAAFIAKTLEEELGKYPQASVVHGDIYFFLFKDSGYRISYDFEPGDFCSLDNAKVPLFKKNLTVTFHEQKGKFTSTDYVITDINLGGQGTPFYPMNTLSTNHSGRNFPWVKTYHYPSHDAKKLYNALLLYVAKELQAIERIDDYRSFISISKRSVYSTEDDD